MGFQYFVGGIVCLIGLFFALLGGGCLLVSCTAGFNSNDAAGFFFISFIPLVIGLLIIKAGLSIFRKDGNQELIERNQIRAYFVFGLFVLFLLLLLLS